MWRLGLRPLDLADWIELGDDYATELAAKSTVRREHPDTVFIALPEATDACQEILDALVDHLLETWPQHFRRRGPEVDNSLTGETVAVDGRFLHPLDAASRLVQEDLVVMIELDDRLVFGAGSVCFPNRWDLRSKLGLPLRDVHAPVNLLNDQLGDTIDKFLARLTPERSFWRLGWGVLDSADLYQPVDGTAAPRPARPVADDLVIRVERETLRRFPRTGGVLFTIRTHLTKAADLATDPDHGPVIAEALAAMPPPVREYKQINQVAEALGELFSQT
jgi:dimethylamine monooxygenase subunit A